MFTCIWSQMLQELYAYKQNSSELFSTFRRGPKSYFKQECFGSYTLGNSMPLSSAVHSSAKSFVLKRKRTTKTEFVHFSFQFYSHSHRFLDKNTTAMYDACSSTVIGIASSPHLISLLASALSWNKSQTDLFLRHFGKHVKGDFKWMH